MLKLYGQPVSNYYNMVKLTLIEKGLPFEEVVTSPSQDGTFLKISPMGKIPALETERGFITETAVILDYLDAAYPEKPLFPVDDFDKAMVKKICHMAALYIDLSIRPLVMKSFMGQTLPEERLEEIRHELEKGCKAIAAQITPSPWLFGNEISAADIVLYYSLQPGLPVAKDHLGEDILKWMPGFDQWHSDFAQRSTVKQVDATIESARVEMQKRIDEFLANQSQ